MKQANAYEELSPVPGREEARHARQPWLCSRHLRMEGMIDDHGFKTEKLRILSDAELALPDICMRPLIAVPVSRLSPLLAGRPGGGEAQRP